ncbi:uncharacterized protein [Littorina saxatilis]|uniref:uncharacterized protein isoform X1 n=2 Tax=Littorina saxatilis TaxID=31220 RepID=UPI0038B432A8
MQKHCSLCRVIQNLHYSWFNTDLDCTEPTKILMETLVSFSLHWLLITRLTTADKHPVSVEKYCAHFTFPNIMEHKLTVEEHSEMVLPFTINNSCNNGPLNHTAVTINKAFGGHEIVCYFEHPPGRCKEYDQPYCECPSEISRLHRLVIPVDRSDAGVWKWSATNSDEIEDAVVTLVVTYPAEIEEMTFWSKGNPVTSPVVQNSSVTILCSWDKGVPAVTSYLRLLDRRGNELQRTDSSNQKEQINYTVSSVQCDHAGLIMCEAEGGSLQKNRTLLVECAPKVYSPSKDIIISSPTEDLRVEFSVRSHSVHIMKCCLKKIKESPGVTSKHNTTLLSHSCKRHGTYLLFVHD